MNKTLKLTAIAILLSSTAQAADDGLIVLDWSGYDDPGFIGAYVEKHGDGPSYSFFGEEEEAFQKLRSGFRADVAHPCAQSVSKWREAGVIEPIDISRIPRWDEVNEIKEGFHYEDGYYFLPTDWGTTSIVYRNDLVAADKVASLTVFLDPELAGRISLPDNVDDAYALAYLATGLSDWTKATEADFEKASAWLRQVHPNIRTYWADGAELGQLLTTGEVTVAWAWNETPTTLKSEGIAISSNRMATEGSSSWFCGYVNVVDGPNSEDKMYDFFNAWTEPATTEYIVGAWGYGGGNQVAMTALGAEALDAVGLGEVTTPVLAQAPMDNRLRQKMIVTFEEIKSGF
jgi:spermidine/putrescine transport system substrate-binding protein